MKNLKSSFFLRIGAGPMVFHAFQSRNLSDSFAMVVQCSFFCALHHEDTIAAAIVSHYQRMQSPRPQDGIIPVPDQEKIRGVLVACQEQTSAFDWSQLCFEIADRIGYVKEDGGLRIPDRLLTSL
jgi:hypothetical protein